MNRSDDAQELTESPAPLWRNRDYVLLRGGQAVSVAGSQVSTIAYPLLVLALTHSPGQAGIVGFCNTVPVALFTLPAGALVDRWNRKRLMILCDAARAIALGSIVILALLGHLTLAQLGLTAFLEGSCGVVFRLAETGAIPHVVPAEQLTAAVSQNEAATRGAQMVGPGLGGLLFTLGQAIPFLADAVSYAVSVLSLSLIRTEFQEERVANERALWSEIGEGLRWVFGQPFIRITVLLIAGSNLLFSAMMLVIVVLAKHLGGSPAAIGLIFSLFGAGGLLGSIAARWIQRWIGFAQVVIGVNWLWALLWPAYAIAPDPLVIGVISAVMVFGGAAWNVVLGSYLIGTVPDALRGRVQSVALLIAWGVIPLGSLLAGLLLQTIGAVHCIIVLSIVMLLLAIVATLDPHVRHAPSVTDLPVQL